MIEKKFIVDRYITLPKLLPAIPGQLDTVYREIVTVPNNPFYLNESEKFQADAADFFRKKKSEIRAGHGAKAHRNFVWLPYQPGVVSQVELEQADIITGPMSGCWCVIYRDTAQKKVFAAHIGTADTIKDRRTIRAKNTWNTFVRLKHFEFIGAFNPFTAIQIPPRKPADDGGPKIFAIMTSAYQLFSVCLYAHKTQDYAFRVASLTKVPTKLEGEFAMDIWNYDA